MPGAAAPAVCAPSTKVVVSTAAKLSHRACGPGGILTGDGSNIKTVVNDAVAGWLPSSFADASQPSDAAWPEHSAREGPDSVASHVGGHPNSFIGQISGDDHHLFAGAAVSSAGEHAVSHPSSFLGQASSDHHDLLPGATGGHFISTAHSGLRAQPRVGVSSFSAAYAHSASFLASDQATPLSAEELVQRQTQLRVAFGICAGTVATSTGLFCRFVAKLASKLPKQEGNDMREDVEEETDEEEEESNGDFEECTDEQTAIDEQIARIDSLRRPRVLVHNRGPKSDPDLASGRETPSEGSCTRCDESYAY